MDTCIFAPSPSEARRRRVNNETEGWDVFFDNLSVKHYSGPITEETHYYPFGLTMSGISSKALAFGEPKNKEKTFQGQRFDDDLGVNYIQFKYRSHDPQIGRFIQIDPLADEYEYNSTYAFSENKVTNHIELEGLEAISADLWRQALQAPPQAKVALGIAAGIVFLGELVYEGVKAGGSNNSMTLIPESMNRDVMKTYIKDGTEGNSTFNGKNDTESKTANEALRNAKDQNGIPRSQQPDKTIKPNTGEGTDAKLDNRNVKQYEYTNSKGEKVTIRQDKPANYNDGGKGDQPPHFNAGESGKKLQQHHNYVDRPKPASKNNKKPFWQF